MSNPLHNPMIRLAGRAAVAGITAGIATHSEWKAAVTAGILAFCEVFTPLNAVVGWFKTIQAVPVPPVAPQPPPRPGKAKPRR